MAKPSRDILDTAVAFLQKRDGTDKALKICRYSVKLLLAVALKNSPPESEAVRRLKSFESSVGASRKALRIGKFLQDVDALRKAPPYSTTEGFLELIASGGEGVYYFVEQLVWLVKTGTIDKRHSRHFQKISAWAEFIGYFGSVALKSIEITTLVQKERSVSLQITSQPISNGGSCISSHQDGSSSSQDVTSSEENATKVLKALQFKRLLKTLSLIQDLSDALLALHDILEDSDGKSPLGNPALLAACGLLSALISIHKNWVSV
ncbi:hypothetical protein CLOP_g1782 [Closterium sp. NIES-67]|nr:hypothetical protein CLOP_g1782 [Closterium sp. NIES-67]